jgi:hypothetical protein
VTGATPCCDGGAGRGDDQDGLSRLRDHHPASSGLVVRGRVGHPPGGGAPRTALRLAEPASAAGHGGECRWHRPAPPWSVSGPLRSCLPSLPERTEIRSRPRLSNVPEIRDTCPRPRRM